MPRPRHVVGLRLGILAIAALAAAIGVVEPATASMSALPVSPPPEASLVRNTAVWPGYVVLFFLGAVIITISLMPSRRAHTD